MLSLFAGARKARTVDWKFRSSNFIKSEFQSQSQVLVGKLAFLLLKKKIAMVV